MSPLNAWDLLSVCLFVLLFLLIILFIESKTEPWYIDLINLTLKCNIIIHPPLVKHSINNILSRARLSYTNLKGHCDELVSCLIMEANSNMALPLSGTQSSHFNSVGLGRVRSAHVSNRQAPSDCVLQAAETR